MKRELGIACNSVEDLKLVKGAGFDSIFTGVYKLERVAALKNECEKLGLHYDFIHAPFFVTEPSYIHCNEFWRTDLTYLPLYNAILESIDSAAETGIDLVMLHVSGGWIAPPITDKGLARFDDVVAYALKKNIRIAFENLRNVGNLAAIMERYENIPQVGYCYDCGHEHCYTENVHFLDLYGNRTFCTHLHDNFGKDKVDPLKDADYHLLPFEGEINYEEMIDLMDKYNYKGGLTLEVGQYEKFKDLTREEFFATCYERVKRISDYSKKPD